MVITNSIYIYPFNSRYEWDIANNWWHEKFNRQLKSYRFWWYIFHTDTCRTYNRRRSIEQHPYHSITGLDHQTMEHRQYDSGNSNYDAVGAPMSSVLALNVSPRHRAISKLNGRSVHKSWHIYHSFGIPFSEGPLYG